MNATHRAGRWVVVAVVLGGAVWSVPAECTPRWLYAAEDKLPGPDSTVNAMMTWDPDGPGPEPEELVVAGSFTSVNGVPANRIARWNGTEWRPLGTGLTGLYAGVAALAIYDGELIAGGHFSTAGGVTCSSIARWDGANWHPLGTGMDDDVYALAVYDGALIAGGRFWIAGGVSCSQIASWDGASWWPLGTGTNGSVRALAVYDGALIVGGRFSSAGDGPVQGIARWDSSPQTWSPMGSGFYWESWYWPDPCVCDPTCNVPCPPVLISDPGELRSLTVLPSGDLVAGGRFTAANGVGGMYNIARWTGSSWQALGAGVGWGDQDEWVYAMTVLNEVLYVGGKFLSAGGGGANRIAQWNGTAWEPLGVGVNGAVYAFAEYRGELVVGGGFDLAGDRLSEHWARWGCPAPPVCPGDGNCDSAINWRDIDYLVAAQNDNVSAWTALFPEGNATCPFLNLDTNADGHVNWRDIDPFIALMNTTCP
jgi:hypothetical protein